MSESEAAPGPGDLLREAREALGISRREMADRLNWMPSYVAAVEENRFEVLRSGAFVRGYLRAYAKLVGVPEDVLMHAYDALPVTEGDGGETTKRVESRVPQIQKRGIAIPAGAAIVVLLIALLWFRNGEDQQAAKKTPAITDVHNEVDAPRQADALVQKKALSLLVASGSGSAAPEAAAPESAGQAEPGPGSAAGSEAAVAAESSAAGLDGGAVLDSLNTAQPGPALSDNVTPAQSRVINVAADDAADAVARGQLQFRFTGDCWIEVRNATDELIYADLRRDGDILNLAGSPPFSVLVGNSSVVALAYQGEAVSIPRRPGRSVSKFVVGEE